MSLLSASRVFFCLFALLFAAQSTQAALVGYWNFNEGAGTTVNDFTASANTGSLDAGGQGIATQWVTGQTGAPTDKALDFQGRTDRVVVPIVNPLALTNTFTIAYWAKSDFLGAYPYQILFTNDSNGTARQWFIQGDNGGADQMYMWSDANTNWRKGLGFKVGGGATANLNWHHYAFVYSGGVVTPYVDGVAKTPQTIGGSPNFPAFTHVLIGGKNQNFTSWEGPIDEVVIFNTVEDVASIMNGTHAAMVAPVVWSGGGTPNGSGQLVWTSAANWGGVNLTAGRAIAFATSNGLTTNFNDFAANTQFNGITFNTGAGAFTLNGNAINLTANVANNSASTQTIGNTLVMDGGDRTFSAASGNIVVSNSIGEAQAGRGLVKSGANTLTLSAGGGYTGTTTVNAGTLMLTGTISSTAAATVTGSTSALAGNGTVAGAVTAISGGHLSPGINASTTGTLALGGGLVLNAANLDIKAAAPGTSDLVSVTGNLTLTGNTTVNLTQLAGFTYGEYVILTYTGTLTGNVSQIIPPTQTPTHAYSITTAVAGPVKQIKLQVSVPAAAASYYVSQSTGSDTNNGLTTGAPFQTLAKASTINLNPGDTIYLKRGDTWNEELQPKGNGTPANPITITAYGTGNMPVIDRANANVQLNGIHLINQEGYKITHIEFARTPTGIYAEYSASTPGNVVTRRHIWIEDCYFRDSLFYGWYGDYPANKAISLAISFWTYESISTHAPDNISLQDVTIKNCTFRRMASSIWTNNPDNFNTSINADNRYNFANFVIQGCVFEEGWQWQQGIRGVVGGAVRDCVTVDIGRGFTAFNGVAGGLWWRSKYWVFENSEWGYISRNGGASGDGEAFDFEGNCRYMVMRNCLFHDTDGPGFLISEGAAAGHLDLRMENCVLNGKAVLSTLTRSEVFYTQYDPSTWINCRFYLSSGEVLTGVQYGAPQFIHAVSFVNSHLKPLNAATSSTKLTAAPTASTGAAANANDGNTGTDWVPSWPPTVPPPTSPPALSNGEWIQLDLGAPVPVNEFRIRENTATDFVTRYEIQYWEPTLSKWVSIFNGRAIGSNFVAPIVSRTMQQVRLWISKTNGNTAPKIQEFQAYNDSNFYSWTFTSPRGVNPPSGLPGAVATTTTLTASPTPSTSGSRVTFTATVTPASGIGIPTGPVTFKDGAATIGTGTLNFSGVATFSTTALSVGTHPITAVFPGTTYITTSTSNTVSQVVNP